MSNRKSKTFSVRIRLNTNKVNKIGSRYLPMAETYYRYHDDDINKDFYYNADSQQTVWEFPTETAVVYDPDTMEVIPPPPPTYEETPYMP